MNAQYIIPFRKALATPVLIMGVERSLFYYELLVVLALASGTRFGPLLFTIPIIAAVLHSFCVMATRSDPLITALFIRSWRHRPNFHPALSSYERIPPEKVRSSFPDVGMKKQGGRWFRHKLEKLIGKGN